MVPQERFYGMVQERSPQTPRYVPLWAQIPPGPQQIRSKSQRQLHHIWPSTRCRPIPPPPTTTPSLLAASRTTIMARFVSIRRFPPAIHSSVATPSIRGSSTTPAPPHRFLRREPFPHFPRSSGSLGPVVTSSCRWVRHTSFLRSF